MGRNLDVKDLIILKMVANGASVREMAHAIGATSSNTAHKRLETLIDDGLVTAPPRLGMARSWKLTDTGKLAVAPYVNR